MGSGDNKSSKRLEARGVRDRAAVMFRQHSGRRKLHLGLKEHGICLARKKCRRYSKWKEEGPLEVRMLTGIGVHEAPVLIGSVQETGEGLIKR